MAMNVKEKLVELLDRFVYDEWYDNDEIADELISNGVTVQEWISVDDRLPEPFESVLVFRDGKIMIDHHEENGWFAYDFNRKRATHWMQIPKPPKGGIIVSRLIDADALKAKAIRCETFKLYDAPVFLKAVATKEIDRAPTIDAVEVVRCKDCKHHYWEQEPCHGKSVHYCELPHMRGIEVFKEFFCYYGERKDNKNGVCNTL